MNLTILPALIPADYDAYAKIIAEERVTMVEVSGASPASLPMRSRLPPARLLAA